jgi:predicted dehydrogenase
MGSEHALAYKNLPGFKIVALANRTIDKARQLAARLNLDVPVFSSFEEALALKPEVMSINTYPDTHAQYVIRSLEAGCHIFVEKPIARTAKEADAVFAAVKKSKKKLIAGYGIRVHPGWLKFIEVARTLGKPLIMRMNLNQQSFGHEWQVHRNMIAAMPPLIDCGVHYIDVMCMMTRSKPVQVQAIGARVSDQIAPELHNYGQLQLMFDDGSVGWYEVGWGPMMSRTAYFIKDVVGPKGSVSMDKDPSVDPSDVSKHGVVGALILHSSATDADGRPLEKDRIIPIEQEPTHEQLCRFEQELLYRAITEDLDLSERMQAAVSSLKIGLAAVESIRKKRAIALR